MTKEQVSELKRLIQEWTGGHEQAAYAGVAAAPILRVIEERERLLEGLKDATNAIIGEWGQAKDLEAIIHYAEEEV